MIARVRVRDVNTLYFIVRERRIGRYEGISFAPPLFSAIEGIHSGRYNH